MKANGIDVSSFQGNVNWNEVNESDVDFAMIRATFGTAGVDNKFARNISGVKNTGIKPGAYHYCYAHNTDEAAAEARHFIDVIRPYPLHYPAALDIEERSIANLGKNAVTDIIVTFLDILRNENFYPMLYVDLNWLNNYVDSSRLDDVDVWLAEWDETPPNRNDVTMWQYSQNGNVPGIETNVDLSVSYKDYPSIIEEKGLNGTGEPTEYPDPEAGTRANALFYRVEKGNTLWGIAEFFLGDGNRFREIMNLNRLTDETIYPGQILQIPQNKGNGAVLYRVRKGDTLWGIARRFLGDGNMYPYIMTRNGLRSETIYPGQILKVPVTVKNDSDLS